MSSPLPNEIIEEIMIYTKFIDLTNLSKSNKYWRMSFQTKGFWINYLKNKSQKEFKTILKESSKRGYITIVNILWSTNFENIIRNRMDFCQIWFDSLILGFIDIANLIETFGVIDGTDEDIIDRRDNLIKYGTAKKLYQKKKFTKIKKLLDYEYIYQLVAEKCNSIEKASKLLKSDIKKENIDEIIIHSFEYNNISLIDEIKNKFNLDKDFLEGFAICGISSPHYNIIFYTLHLIGLEDFDDITPELLIKLIGKDMVTMLYKPLREQYITNYPEDAWRIIEGSYFDMELVELIGYLENLDGGIDIAKCVCYEAEYSENDYYMIKVKEWIDKKINK